MTRRWKNWGLSIVLIALAYTAWRNPVPLLSWLVLKDDHVIVELTPDLHHEALVPRYAERWATSQWRTKRRAAANPLGHATLDLMGDCLDTDADVAPLPHSRGLFAIQSPLRPGATSAALHSLSDRAHVDFEINLRHSLGRGDAVIDQRDAAQQGPFIVRGVPMSRFDSVFLPYLVEARADAAQMFQAMMTLKAQDG